MPTRTYSAPPGAGRYEAAQAAQAMQLEREWRASISGKVDKTAEILASASATLERLSAHYDELDKRVTAIEERPEKARDTRINLMSAQGQKWSAILAGAAIVIALLAPWLAHLSITVH